MYVLKWGQNRMQPRLIDCRQPPKRGRQGEEQQGQGQGQGQEEINEEQAEGEEPQTRQVQRFFLQQQTKEAQAQQRRVIVRGGIVE